MGVKSYIEPLWPIPLDDVTEAFGKSGYEAVCVLAMMLGWLLNRASVKFMYSDYASSFLPAPSTKGSAPLEMFALKKPPWP